MVLDEIDRLKGLIEKSHLIEVPASCVDYSSGHPIIKDSGTMLVPEGYIEKEKEKTELLQRVAKLTREVSFLKNELQSFRSAVDYTKGRKTFSVNGSGWAMIDPHYLSELLERAGNG